MIKRKKDRHSIKADQERKYDNMQKYCRGQEDFRRPAYSVKCFVPEQKKHQIHETPVEYIARKYGIRGEKEKHESK